MHNTDAQGLVSSLITSVVTAFVVVSPEITSYAEKLVSVLVLAMVAEIGRRCVAKGVALLQRKKT